jgi:hypothetical protein
MPTLIDNLADLIIRRDIGGLDQFEADAVGMMAATAQR